MDTNIYGALVDVSSAVSSASPPLSGIPQQSIWEEHRSMFFQLYVKEKKTLREVKVIAEKDFGFPRIPLSTYESKFKNELGLKKKLKWFDWIAIHHHISQLGHPKVEVLLDGNLIAPKKVKKEINRNLKKGEGCGITTGASNLPEGVKIRPVSQEITTDDRQIIAISPAVPQSSMVDASLNLQPFPTDVESPSSFAASQKIISNQVGISFTMDPPLVDNCFGSSGMSMEVAESLFFSTAKEVPHITSRLPGTFQMTYDFLISRPTLNHSATSILVVDPEFQKLWPSMLDHLPIMRALIDPAVPHLYFQGGDRSWSSDEDFFIDTGNTPPLYYLSSVEPRHQRLTRSVQELYQLTAPPVDAPLSTFIDVFHAINGVLYLFSNNPNHDEAFEYVRRLVAQNMPWSTVEAILKIPSHTIQSTWVLLADCAFKLFVRRLFDAVVSPASDHKKWRVRYGRKWLTQAAVLGSAALCRKLMQLGVSSDISEARDCVVLDGFGPRELRHDIGPWTTTILQTQSSCFHRYCGGHISRPSLGFNQLHQTETHTSPLIEAAVRGHVETVAVLMEGDANLEQRINGCTAIGHLLHSLFQNNVNLEARLQVLREVLELGAQVDVPFYDAPQRTYYMKGSQHTIPNFSQDTIADMVCQTNCQEAIHLVQKYAKACLSRLTVQGILQAASNSVEELADLLGRFQASTPAEQLSLEGTALMKAIDKPDVLLKMIKAGLDLHKPRVLIYINFGYGGLEYAQIESFVPRNIILGKYLALIVEQPSHPFARQILQSVSPTAWPITRSTFGLLQVCRTSDSWSLLLHTGVQLQKPFLISALAQAARENNHNSMEVLLGLLGDINYSLRTGPISWNVLILAAIAEPFADINQGLDLSEGPASIETLDWLIAHGASSSDCVKNLDSIQDFRRSIVFDTQRLEWLLAHNIRPQGKSLCGIFMDYVSLDSWSVTPPEITTSLFEPPKMTGLPLFEPCSAMIDQSGQSVIKEFALVYFIKVGAPADFLEHLCNSGIDYNAPAKFCDIDKEPLSWHFYECRHESPQCKCLTPLQAAISAYRVDIVRYLLEKGANTNDGAHYNSLQLACTIDQVRGENFAAAMFAKIEIVKCLLRNGADPGRTQADTQPALRLTIRNHWDNFLSQIVSKQLFLGQHLRLLEVLLDASVGTDHFDTILTGALRDVSQLVDDRESQEAVTKLLLRYKSDIDKQAWLRAPYGVSLMEACRKCDVDRIKILLDQGVNPNWFQYPADCNYDDFKQLSPHPSTPSAELAAQGNIPLLLLLRAAGAELTRHDNSLECAVTWERLDTVAWLLQFEEREVALARAMMRAHLQRFTSIKMLIKDHLHSIGSDLLENDNWKHPLYYSKTERYAAKITGEDLEYGPLNSRHVCDTYGVI